MVIVLVYKFLKTFIVTHVLFHTLSIVSLTMTANTMTINDVSNNINKCLKTLQHNLFDFC